MLFFLFSFIDEIVSLSKQMRWILAYRLLFLLDYFKIKYVSILVPKMLLFALSWSWTANVKIVFTSF